MMKRIANWGNFPVVESDVESFSFPDQLHRLLEKGGAFIPRGNGRCYGDASLAPRVISTLKFDKMLGFDPAEGIFECQSGLLLDQILPVIIPKGWFLPVTPGTKYITVGGAVASNIHGKNHHVDGPFSNHILEMDLVLASGGSVTCSSGRNADLFEATCGGMGLTGIITRVKFRLKKIETSYIEQKQIRAENLEELIHLFEYYRRYTYSVAWIDCLTKGAHFGRGILMLGEHARITGLSDKQRQHPLQVRKRSSIPFLFSLPSWLLNPLMVKAFNQLYYSRNLKKEKSSVVSFESFFYPLDAVLHWNRAYGKRGFIQYQFVLPLNARAGLVEIMNRISDRGSGSFLAVLKVLGKQESIISFPKEGYTLALDFPVRPGLLPFLDELDQIVLRWGGRLYLSKDARMKPETLQNGYPGLDKFRDIVRRYNPDNRICSMQSERLFLTGN
jgi:FAD/FMN-containing dehydrogenase